MFGTTWQSQSGFALLAVVLMIVGFLAIISMVSVQRLILLVNMCGEEKAFFQAHYLAQSAKAMALYYLYDTGGVEACDSLRISFDVNSILIGDYQYIIKNCSTAGDWIYKIDVCGFYPTPGVDTTTEVAVTIYTNDSGGDLFKPVTEFVEYRR